jgi:hypothetical protein
MAIDARRLLMQQHETAWALAHHHLAGLGTQECLWRPAGLGLHVQRQADGRWIADWPEHEGYAIGPPSIAWLTWHMLYWWSMLLDHGFGSGHLDRGAVCWPGDGPSVATAIAALRQRWCTELGALSNADFASSARTKWPFANRPFADVVAWANVELTKNAAEIGYARFLFAVRH